MPNAEDTMIPPPRRTKPDDLVLALIVTAPIWGTIVLLDGVIGDVIVVARGGLGGDVRRTLEALQQFGDFATMTIAIIIIGLLDRERFRRALDWLVAAAGGFLIFNAMKLATGRLRPGPFPNSVDDSEGVSASATDFFAWGLAKEIGYDRTFAFPSTHTTHAVIAAVFLASMYPRLRVLVYSWAALVGVCRVLFGAHWPSDVLAGAVLGYVLARLIVDHYVGVRLIDWLWRVMVDRRATPALPRVMEAEREALARAHGSRVRRGP